MKIIPLLVLGLFIFSCNKGKRPPIVTTSAIFEIFPKTARGGGILYSEGNAPVTEKGLCWSLSHDPTVRDSKVSAGEGEGNFSAELTDLQPLTKYYVRAYAINKFGTTYGKETSLTTPAPTPLPYVNTIGPISVGLRSISCAVAISDMNSQGLISVGLCWNTQPSPTINHNKTSQPFTALTFTDVLTGLEPNTVYYIRSYAINNSGVAYGNELAILTFAGTVTDIDGNLYLTKIFGGQEWMVQNLRVTKYRDGSPISSVTSSQQWISLNEGGYCIYDNDPVNEPIYGKLYNWFAVTDPKKIAPAGWHVPTDSDWQALMTALGGEDYAGDRMKSLVLWHAGGNNQSGFSALPGGGRGNTGSFSGLTFSAGFWSSSADLSTQSWLYSTLYNSQKLFRISADNVSGYSIRCVKD